MPERFRYGIEHELAILRGGVFADFTDLTFDELQSVVDVLPLDAADYPDLRVGDQGIKRKRWYVEGYERFDDQGELVRCDPKGLEVRTRIHDSVEAAVDALAADIDLLNAAARAARAGVVRRRVQPAALGLRDRPAAGGVGARAPHRLARGAHRAPAHGDLRPRPQPLGRRPRAVVDAARKLTHYSPWLVPLSFSSPFRDGQPWGGLSARTHLRTGARPAALAFLGPDAPQIASDPSLTQPARLPRRSADWSSRRSTRSATSPSTASCSACSRGWCSTTRCRAVAPRRTRRRTGTSRRSVSPTIRCTPKPVRCSTAAERALGDRPADRARLAALRARWSRRECQRRDDARGVRGRCEPGRGAPGREWIASPWRRVSTHDRWRHV